MLNGRFVLLDSRSRRRRIVVKSFGKLAKGRLLVVVCLSNLMQGFKEIARLFVLGHHFGLGLHFFDLQFSGNGLVQERVHLVRYQSGQVVAFQTMLRVNAQP